MTRAAALVVAFVALLAGPARAADAGWPDSGPGVGAGGARWMGPRPPAHPERIVSLAPSATDIVIALGQAKRIVGVTRYDTAPEVRGLPGVGGFLDPSPEAVLGLRPDLVLWITDGGALSSVRRIAELGLPVLALPVVGVDDVVSTARVIGNALGEAAAGERLARSIQDSVARTRERAAGLRRPRVLFAVGRQPLVVAGPGSYPDELLRIAGAENVVKNTIAWPVYPLEKALADDPDIVIDSALMEGGAGGGQLPILPVTHRGRLVRLEDDDALRPGPHLIPTLEVLFAILHPEAARRP